MMEELKPCPICGGSCLSICDHGGMVHHEYRIECNNGGCSCQTGVRTKEEAIAAWNALPRRLKWTREKPTDNGWYFHRDVDEHGGSYTTVLYWDKNLMIESGVWAGPIQEPEEK